MKKTKQKRNNKPFIFYTRLQVRLEDFLKGTYDDHKMEREKNGSHEVEDVSQTNLYFIDPLIFKNPWLLPYVRK